MRCKFMLISLLRTLTLYHSVDERILQHMVETGAEFLMEVTDKTKADVKVRCLAEISVS